MQEANPFTAPKKQSAAHQPRIAPTADRLGRNAEHFAQLVHRVNGLRDFGDLHVSRIAEVFDQQTQVMLEIGRSDAVATWGLWSVVRDSKTNVVKCIRSIGLDLAIEFFCKPSLLDLLRLRSESSELVSKFLDFCVAIIFVHRHLSQCCTTRRCVPCDPGGSLDMDTVFARVSLIP